MPRRPAGTKRRLPSVAGCVSIIVAVALLAAGCGPGGVGATAVGVVTIDGTPAPAGIRIDFQPRALEGSPSMGITDAQGRYELYFTAARKGVVPGECQVRLEASPATGPDGVPGAPSAPETLRIPKAYAGDQSPVFRTVKPGHNTIDIAIDTATPPITQSSVRQ